MSATSVSSPAPATVQAFERYLLASLLWGLALLAAGTSLQQMSAWAVFALTVLFAIPMMLGGLYRHTVTRITRLAGFSSRGWLYRLFSRRLIATLVWGSLAVLGSFLMLLQFLNYDKGQWITFFAVIPCFYLLFRLGLRIGHQELKPYLQTAFALKLAQRATPITLVLLQSAYLYFWQLPAETAGLLSLQEAIARYTPAPAVPGSSVLVHELSNLLAYYDGLKLFFHQLVRTQGGWAQWLVMILVSWMVFFTASSMLSCLLISRTELRRVFVPLSDQDLVDTPKLTHSILIAAFSVLIVFFILLPGFAWLEQLAQNRPTVFNKIKEPIVYVILRIDGIDYLPQVRTALQTRDEEYARDLLALEPQFAAQRTQLYQALAGNVDSFLDWYYSLTGENMRLLKLLSGRLDDYLASQLRSHLHRGPAIAEYDRAFAALKEAHQTLHTQYEIDRQQILDRHRASAAESTLATNIVTTSWEELLDHQDRISLQQRLGGSAGAGLASSLIVGKIISQLSAKGVFKVAAKPLVKLAGSRIASLASSTAIGAVSGSAVPVVGTGLGAAIGLGVGVLVDFGLLKGEELLSREKFRQQLLETIQKSLALPD